MPAAVGPLIPRASNSTLFINCVIPRDANFDKFNPNKGPYITQHSTRIIFADMKKPFILITYKNHTYMLWGQTFMIFLLPMFLFACNILIQLWYILVIFIWLNDVISLFRLCLILNPRPSSHSLKIYFIKDGAHELKPLFLSASITNILLINLNHYFKLYDKI